MPAEPASSADHLHRLVPQVVDDLGLDEQRLEFVPPRPGEVVRLRKGLRPGQAGAGRDVISLDSALSPWLFTAVTASPRVIPSGEPGSVEAVPVRPDAKT